jgi:hypothetical protein
MRLVLFALVCILFFACREDNKPSHKSYYFPIDQLSDTAVYIYEIDHNGEKYKHYYQLNTSHMEGKTFLSTLAFDRYFDLSEQVLEEITDNGAQVIYYRVTEKDENNQSYISPEAKLEYSAVFSWKFEENKPITWQFHYDSELYANTDVWVTRYREFRGKMTNINYDSKSYPSMELRDQYIIEYKDRIHKSEGTTFDFRQRSYYAKGLGMIGFEKTFDGDIIKGQLVEIIPNREFGKRESMYKQSLKDSL